MQEINIAAWREFEAALQTISERQQTLVQTHVRTFGPPFFRGMGDCAWGLRTTLERSHPFEMFERFTDLRRYYEHVLRAQAAIETFTDNEWDGFPELDELLKAAEEGPQHFFNDHLPVYRFLIYLRHHGYPSPLLDWTASPYIAAFFAFDSMPETAQGVTIYAMIRDSTFVTGANVTQVNLMGPYVRSHRRHIIQQCRYTICTRGTTQICGHDEGVQTNGSIGVAGEFMRINIPKTERAIALKRLDLMNINPYSLFGTEDTLMRTISRREGLFRHF
jgi:hypothetical protein